MKRPIVIPKLGAEMHNGTILQWYKKVGDAVKFEEPVCEIQAEKMNCEVEALYPGVICEIIGKVGEKYNVGEPIGYIEESKEE